MQLHVCLLLFLLRTDQIQAWSDQQCGGNVSLDQQSGDIRLPLPGRFNDTRTLNLVTQHSNRTVQTCTWVLYFPSGRTVLLKLDWSGGGPGVLVHCAGSEEGRVSWSGDMTLLAGCDGNKATLSWRGTGHSSDSLQLAYFVQEDERNSSEDRSRTGSTGTNIATVAPKEVEEDRRRLYDILVGSFGPPFASSTSSQDEGPLRPTLPQQGLPVSGRADRETLPFPEEKLNNGADTSGASHLTNDPTSSTTLPYFQHAIRADRTSQTENPAASQTNMSWTDSVMTSLGTDLYTSAFTETSTLQYQNVTQTDQSVSDSRVLTISPSEMPTLEPNTILYPLDGAIGSTPEDQQARPWTSWQRIDGFNSDLTSDPLKSSTKPPQHVPSIANVDSRPTQSSSSSSSGTRSLYSHFMELDATILGTASSLGDSSTADVPTWTAAAEPFDEKFGNADVLHSLAPSTQSQANTPGTPVRSSYTPPWKQTLTEDVQNNTHMTTNPVLFLSDKDVGRTPPFFETVPHDDSLTDSTPLSSSTTTDSSVLSNTLRTHVSHGIHTTSTSSVSESSHSHHLPSSTNITEYKQPHSVITATTTSPPSTTIADYREVKGKKKDQFRQQSTTAGPALQSSQQSLSMSTPSVWTATPTPSSTTSPVFYVVPNQPATIRVDSVELLLQIVVVDFRSASSPGLEEDTAAWVQPYLQRAPGFSKLLGVWSSGHAVQSLVVFKTSGALQWLSMNGHMSLLEQTGLAQAVREGRTFRSSTITNITLGGLQGDVCDWLLQCPAGYKCTPEPGATNHSCSSVCRFDYCHHHGICTHHPGQLPVCRCLVGEDFWYMGQRCNMRMTRWRLVGVCATILLIITAVVGSLAFVAVRHYRAILIQAKVDQTRSSYHKFNHFDELSGRFWLRSWAGSADSLDNPAFTRSDELMHLRALDRPCCFHDDTLSVASTCPSHGAHINTIYPHSSQYGWRGSGMSVGEGVMDSGKASDLSVCSWPVEPIHWTPFPLLQHLASHRTPRVSVTRPRSYCEGMELVDLGKSWTA